MFIQKKIKKINKALFSLSFSSFYFIKNNLSMNILSSYDCIIISIILSLGGIMKLAYWMYAGPAHIGTLRIASSFKNVHAIMHAPLGDDYFV